MSYNGRGRGRGRGRGGGGGGYGSNRFTNTAPSIPLPPDRDIMEGLRPKALQTIPVPTLSSTAKNVEIKDLKTLGSYNWTGATSPTIIVPGSPAEWQNKTTPYQVPADTGLFFIDQNGFRMPSTVLLPLITAVDKTHEVGGNPTAFDWAGGKFDFITDRNGLRKLLRWIDGANDDVVPKDFRIDVQLAGRTVLMNRWEKRTRENYNGFTFGFNFEKASTDPAIGCEDSTGHHRIISYDLNGLKMAVRFEVDACLPVPAQSGSRASTTPASIDDLANSFASVKINPSASSAGAPTTAHGLTVIESGSIGPHNTLIEMTTRTERRAAEFDWQEAYPQLFLSQVPNHFLAVHERGRFITVTKRTLASKELQAVERVLQPSLKKLRAALDVIKSVVVKHGQRGRLTLVCREGKLQVYERVSTASCLPDEIIAKFEN